MMKILALQIALSIFFINSLSLSISLSLYISLYLSISLYISLSLYLSIYLSISIYLYLSLSISIYLYLSIYLHTTCPFSTSQGSRCLVRVLGPPGEHHGRWHAESPRQTGSAGRREGCWNARGALRLRWPVKMGSFGRPRSCLVKHKGAGVHCIPKN